MVRTKRKTAKQTAGHPGAIPNKTGCTACRRSFSLEINSELPKAVPTTVAALIGRYLNDEVEMGRLAYATRKSYVTCLQKWVKPKWGVSFLEQVRTMGVEQWLRVLPLAPKSKVNVRNVLHVLFECAIRWEFVRDNPISRVRQGGGKTCRARNSVSVRVSRGAGRTSTGAVQSDGHSGRLSGPEP